MTLENKAVIGSGTFKTEWGYNIADMLSWMKYPEGNTGLTGEQVSYAYNNQGAVQNIVSDLNGFAYYYLEQATYDAARRLEQADLGAQFIGRTPVLRNDPTYYTWNTTNMGGRMSSNVIQRIAGGTQTRQSLSYQYYASGNISSIVDNLASETQAFTYDEINRLTDVAGAVTEHYDYDAYGRLSSKTGQGTYSYSATRPGNCQANSPTSIIHAVSAVTGKSFSYDCNGNMTGRTISGTTYTLGYDAENRMVSANGGSANNTYTYDGNGVRFKSVVGGVTTVFIGSHCEWMGLNKTIASCCHYVGLALLLP